MANITKEDYNKTRNDYQQYDLVAIFQSIETKILRDCYVATLAYVTKVENNQVICTPFPIREGSSQAHIYAWNMANLEITRGDTVLVLFTDRDFRNNINKVDENHINQTSDNYLHQKDFGIVILKQYKQESESSSND